MFARHYRPGDKIVFSMEKVGTHPTLRAKRLMPSAHGEMYSYEVEKHWIVAEVRPDGHLVAQTRRGKRHVIAPDSPRLRLAHWWELWRHAHLFPSLERPASA
jgi:hypothetical protein